ncbi:MAG: metalloregulator ArsR/SmtB family transcription factor [Methanobacterium sp.]|jgi:DNA-binding transcriptional ArsR family regulator|nr:metalloregulator ArsR/SmtB family transcription factor [Methanobacterium sp.]
MNDDDICDIQCINENSVRGVKSQMLQDETFQIISDHFKVLSDPTRVKILYALTQKEICVCDLAAVLEITDSAVSHQLRLLRDKNLVKFRKEGKMAYYSISNNEIIDIIKMGTNFTKK